MIGSADDFSASDILKLKRMYKCSEGGNEKVTATRPTGMYRKMPFRNRMHSHRASQKKLTAIKQNFVISLQARKIIAKLLEEKNVSSHLFIMETLIMVALLMNLSMKMLGVPQVQIGTEKSTMKLGEIVNQDVQDMWVKKIFF